MITSDGGGATAAVSIAENTTAVTTVTATDPDAGQTLSFSITGGADAAKFSINPTTGVLSFVSAPNFENPTDAGANNVYDVQVTVTDNGTGNLTDVQAIAVTVTDVNEPPVAHNDVATIAEDGVLNGTNLLSNDTDPDGNVLTINTIPASGPTHGTLIINSNGTYSYTPDANYNGTDNFTYQVCDNGAPSLCSTALVTISVTAVNDPPVAMNDLVTISEDASIIGFNLLANDSDPEGDALTINTTPVAGPSHGHLEINTNGTFNYYPDLNYNGTDSFTYEVCDNGTPSKCALATVTISVAPVNDPPVASTQSVTTPEDTPVSNVIAATDPEGDVLRFSKSGDPLHGTVLVDQSGSYTYSPEPNYNGPDAFQVLINDGNGGKTTITVNVTVTPVNDLPVAVALPTTTYEDKPVNGVVTATDIEGDALTFTKVSDPTHGKVIVNIDGSYVYTPAADYFGPDSFDVLVNDGQGGTTKVTIKLTILPVNDAPSFVNGGNLIFCGNSGMQTILHWATNISAGPANESTQNVLFVVTNNNNALFSVQPFLDTNGSLYFGLASNQSGTATVSVQLTDDGGTLNGGINTSPIQTFTITVNALPESPLVNSMQVFCGQATIADLAATAPVGTSLSWYTVQTGGTQLASNYGLSNSTLYYAESTSLATGCKSLIRSFVTAVIYDIPATPAGDQLQTFCNNAAAKVSDLVVTGLNVKWYATASGGIALQPNTLLVQGAKYFATQSNNVCESVSRFAVTVSLVACDNNNNVQVNHPPVVSDQSKTTVQNQSIQLEQLDFTSKYIDPDNDNLSKIRIESLPLNGKLVLAGIDVVLGQEIVLTDLNKLVFVPNKDFAGETYFDWAASDGITYSLSSAAINITVTAQKVFIPEGFSPNGDGINDFFVIQGADKFIVTLRVFNRWGNKVYESMHYKNDWDGASNVGLLITNQLPGGTYFYTVNFNNGDKEKIGYLTLNR